MKRLATVNMPDNHRLSPILNQTMSSETDFADGLWFGDPMPWIPVSEDSKGRQALKLASQV